MLCCFTVSAFSQASESDSSQVLLDWQENEQGSAYWTCYLVDQHDHRFNLNPMKEIPVLKGEYQLLMVSNFYDYSESKLLIKEDRMKICPTLPFTYQFPDFKPELIREYGSEIEIRYKNKKCSGGMCRMDVDLIQIYPNNAKTCWMEYYKEVQRNIDCLDYQTPPLKKKKIKVQKLEHIAEYLIKYGQTYDRNKINVLFIKIGHNIFMADAGDYYNLRNRLLK